MGRTVVTIIEDHQMTMVAWTVLVTLRGNVKHRQVVVDALSLAAELPSECLSQMTLETTMTSVRCVHLMRAALQFVLLRSTLVTLGILATPANVRILADILHRQQWSLDACHQARRLRTNTTPIAATLLHLIPDMCQIAATMAHHGNHQLYHRHLLRVPL
jgi:hypothetical protein